MHESGKRLVSATFSFTRVRLQAPHPPLIKKAAARRSSFNTLITVAAAVAPEGVEHAVGRRREARAVPRVWRGAGGGDRRPRACGRAEAVQVVVVVACGRRPASHSHTGVHHTRTGTQPSTRCL